jgi:hypothetical protein
MNHLRAAVFANRRFFVAALCVAFFQIQTPEAFWLSAANSVPSGDEQAAAQWKAELAERSRWWSLQPPARIEPSDVADPVWQQEPVDRYVFSSLEAAGLEPAESAGPEVLLRRLSFVLTGLPPVPERVEEFRSEFSTNPDSALETLVDELLASPHFGERFARHWMDAVRYTDTYGYEWDIPAKGSWEYRDYLIRAFNDDIGYDQLIREQIAGDLLDPPRINEEVGLNESLIGPMFYHFGEHRHGSSIEFNGIHQEMIDNKIDAFSKTFLAMTVACARCHDHKLDAISQADYYALAGVFMTPRWTARCIDVPGKNDAAIDELKNLREQIRGELAQFWSKSVAEMNGRFLEQWSQENSDALSALKAGDIGFPLQQLVDSDDTMIEELWTRQADDWQTLRRERIRANENFTVVADFTESGFPDDWSVEGEGFAHGFVKEATPRIALDGDALIAEFLPRGYHTHALSSKLPGAIRLPEPERFPESKLSLLLAGGEWSGLRAIPQNAFLQEGPKFFDPTAGPSWTTVGLSALKHGVTRVLTEISTATLNSNFPPRTGVARYGKTSLPNEDEGFDKRSWLSITGVVNHETAGVPKDSLEVFEELYAGRLPKDRSQAWQVMAEWLGAAFDRWADDKPKTGDDEILNWMLKQKLLANDTVAAPVVADLVKRYREAEAKIGFPRTVNSMDETAVQPVDYRLNVRGDVYQDGVAIPRNFLEVFAGRHDVANTSGSGRLELAHYLSSRENPQTARVYVNRLWQWIFGTGIVATPSDFGKLGGRPSHPELLDWLALKFMKEGWSTKKLVRRLMLSQTFRQSGEVSVTGADRDPDNRLLHHYPTRRLEAEAIRDSLLAVSGRLNRKLYGRPINPPRSTEDAKKRLFSGPLDSDGRRSIYMEMSIMQPPEFLVGFNLPDLKLPTGRRDVTNVPAQALIMLNDPLVREMAEHWGKQLRADTSLSPEQKVRSIFLTAFSREPTKTEAQRWANEAQRATWSEIAHTLFNAKEFLYYR